jgi:hypothetical protein
LREVDEVTNRLWQRSDYQSRSTSIPRHTAFIDHHRGFHNTSERDHHQNGMYQSRYSRERNRDLRRHGYKNRARSASRLRGSVMRRRSRSQRAETRSVYGDDNRQLMPRGWNGFSWRKNHDHVYSACGKGQNEHAGDMALGSDLRR